ncbi:3-hydroxydecanoyl-[acyl-carrier-protein] dehydratase [Serratia fonticola]|uniref:3-hydroxydecanoyl-[acyl-carrier-protein] dehydratase n=1 Tax=Serratia fonticola TaxID=47917 RepID=A0A4V6Z2P8_SERFO|nr:3-hydroxydecanoyl-[acyl-carrier-protein] dehydratase [Serratia fonticola]
MIIRKLIMGVADGEVLCDGKVIYTASDLKVACSRTQQRSNALRRPLSVAVYFPCVITELVV